eukprot:187181-Prymnesium_polylepis.1
MQGGEVRRERPLNRTGRLISKSVDSLRVPTDLKLLRDNSDWLISTSLDLFRFPGSADVAIILKARVIPGASLMTLKMGRNRQTFFAHVCARDIKPPRGGANK